MKTFAQGDLTRQNSPTGTTCGQFSAPAAAIALLGYGQDRAPVGAGVDRIPEPRVEWLPGAGDLLGRIDPAPIGKSLPVIARGGVGCARAGDGGTNLIRKPTGGSQAIGDAWHDAAPMR